MTALRRALAALHAAERRDREDRSPLRTVDPRAKTVLTAVYIVIVLSTPLTEPLRILTFALYPVMLSAEAGVSHRSVVCRSLVVLPFVMAVAVFNPFYDQTPMVTLGQHTVTRGEMTLVTLPLRAILAFEGLWLLILSTSTSGIVAALCRLGVPRLFATQLYVINRYARLLIGEALAMEEARRARSFGRGNYTLRFWAATVARLLLRSVGRSERIGRAMAARGFEGEMVDMTPPVTWQRRDTRFLAVWCPLLLLLRLQPFIR